MDVRTLTVLSFSDKSAEDTPPPLVLAVAVAAAICLWLSAVLDVEQLSSSELAAPVAEEAAFSRRLDELLRITVRRLAEKEVLRMVPMSEMVAGAVGSWVGAKGREQGRRTGDGDVGILVTPRR